MPKSRRTAASCWSAIWMFLPSDGTVPVAHDSLDALRDANHQEPHHAWNVVSWLGTESPEVCRGVDLSRADENAAAHEAQHVPSLRFEKEHGLSEQVE